MKLVGKASGDERAVTCGYHEGHLQRCAATHDKTQYCERSSPVLPFCESGVDLNQNATREKAHNDERRAASTPLGAVTQPVTFNLR